MIPNLKRSVIRLKRSRVRFTTFETLWHICGSYVHSSNRRGFHGPLSFKQTHLILKHARYITHILTTGNTLKNKVVADNTRSTPTGQIQCDFGFIPKVISKNTKKKRLSILRKYLVVLSWSKHFEPALENNKQKPNSRNKVRFILSALNW